MGKALKAVGTAIVIVGAIAATGGAALAFGAGAGLLGSASLATSAVLSVGSFSVSAGALLTVGSLVSSVGGALSQPKVSTAGSALGWVGDPNGPMHFAVGRIAVAGDLRHKKAYGPNDRMYFSAVTVVSDAGPITEFESFTANDIPVTFDVNGKANTSYFANVMWMRRQLGNQPEASYLASPSGLERGAVLPDWGPSHKLSGKAGFIVTLSENSKGSAYKGQQPKPRHIIKGLRVYDWRQDSTYPGGAGSQRLNDPTTWTFSENPALWAAKWKYGLWEGPTGKGAPQSDYQVGGIGVTPGVIDFASLTELANIADTHGWKVAAWPSTDDDKAQVLNAFLQAAGAYYIEKSGKMSCLHRAAPRVSVATVTAADTAGPIELDTSSSYVDRKNTGVPTYLSEADGWKMTALGEVSAPEWVTQDGGRQRSMPMTYSFVPVAKQAAELMCLGIANTREGISGRIPLKPYMQGIEAGSAFTITEPEFVLNGLKCLALETSYDATTGVHTVTFVSETDGKYAYAYGQSPTPPAPPALEAVDPTFVTPPLPGDWVITPRPPSGDGTQQPGFDLTGLVSNATATAVIVEWGPTAEGPWTQAYAGPPDVTSIPIVGLQSGATYFIAVRYQRASNFSDRYVYGPYVAPTLTAGISDEAIQEVIDEATKVVDDKVKEAAEEIEKAVNLDDLFAGADDLAEAVLKIGRALTEQQQWLDRLGRQDGLPMGVFVQQNVEVLKEADRQEGVARTQLGAALNGNIVAAEQSISVLATNLSSESQARLVLAGRVGSNEGAIVQEANLRIQGDQAEANLRSALALVVNNNRAAAENSLSAAVSDLAAEVSARQLLAVRVGNAEGAITSEASVRANQDGVFLQNFNLLGARKGDSSGWILGQSTVEISGEGTLSQVLSGLRATDGQNSSSITTLQQASGSQASQLTTLSQTVGGQTQSISQLLSVTAGLGARYTLNLNGNGEATSFIADGQTRAIIFKAASLTITDDGNGLSYQPATGRLKIVKGGFKTILGASGGLSLWSGSTSIPDGSEVYDNGTLGVGADGAYFGGRTNNGPFDSGAASSSIINLPKNTWTTIAAVNKRMMQEGDLVGRVSLDVLVTGAPDEAYDYGVEYRIAVANLDGSGAVNVVGNFGSFVPNTWTSIGAWLEGHVTTSFGDRRVLLQVNPTGSTIATASARNGRVRGQYAMSS